MPEISWQKRASGARLFDAGTLPTPDQSRYGPVRTTHGPGLVYSPEGDGTTVTCGACGWLRWEPHQVDAQRVGRAHATGCKAVATAATA
jgi:hypothetical protein